MIIKVIFLALGQTIFNFFGKFAINEALLKKITNLENFRKVFKNKTFFAT